MGLKEDIDAIEADGSLSSDEKRARRHRAKAVGYASALIGLVGQDITWGPYRVRLLRVWPHEGWLALDLLLWVNDAPVSVSNPVMVQEPPIGDGSQAALRIIARDFLAALAG